MNENLIDKFGDMMDELIKSSNVAMLIEMPEGTQEPTIRDNLGFGGVVQFYILLSTMKPVFKHICDDMIADNKTEDLVDGLLELVKSELMDVVNDKSLDSWAKTQKKEEEST